jgi:CheY-like chemotaxis protein
MSADNNTVTATVLLVDDSPTIQRFIELTFAGEDVRVIVAGDGDAAIARIEEQPPDIVLADIGMRGKSGYEVASYIKREPRLSHIPVLLLAGAFEPVDQGKAAETGCDGVLSKPFEPQLVIGRVKELLERSRGVVSAPGVGWPLSASATEAASLPAPVHSDAGSTGSESLGDFFDKLDAAFANLPASRPVAPATDHLRSGSEPAGATPGAAGQNGVPDGGAHAGIGDKWEIEPSPGPDIEMPSFLAPPHDTGPLPPPRAVIRPAPAQIVRPATAALSAVASPAAEAEAMPPLAEVFASLLDAEQPGAAPAHTAAWVRPPIVTDDLVEQVADRVLERLSDRVVRETTARLVSSIAERLVREEIDRIKAAIKNL